MKDKICLVSIYIGDDLPNYIDYFIQGIRINKDVDFLFLSNHTLKFEASNFKQVIFNLEDFNALASKTLSLPIKVTKPYKLCDFKPVIGLMFSHYLVEYNYWGWVDIDLVLGKVRSFLNPFIAEGKEFISVRQNFLSGCLFLVKNNVINNSVFKKSPNYIHVFTDKNEKNYFFDEAGSETLARLYDSYDKTPYSYEERYANIVSMTHIIEQHYNENQYIFKNLVHEFLHVSNLECNDLVTFSENGLYSKNFGCYICIVHFTSVKKRPFFTIQPKKPLANFIITRYFLGNNLFEMESYINSKESIFYRKLQLSDSFRIQNDTIVNLESGYRIFKLELVQTLKQFEIGIISLKEIIDTFNYFKNDEKKNSELGFRGYFNLENERVLEIVEFFIRHKILI